MEQSQHDAEYTLGTRLGRQSAVVMGMADALGTSWTHIKEKCERQDAGITTQEYKKYSIILPDKCERDFRNPLCGWHLNRVGEKGCANNCVKSRSIFYYVFLFTEKQDIVPARASVNNLLYMDETFEENDMAAVNLAQDKYYNQRDIDAGAYRRSPRRPSSRRRSSKRRSKSRSRHYRDNDVSSLEDDLKSMSICVEERRRKPRQNQEEKTPAPHYSETESQIRNQTKGKK